MSRYICQWCGGQLIRAPTWWMHRDIIAEEYCYSLAKMLSEIIALEK